MDSRLVSLLGMDNVSKIRDLRVVIVGLGGVGGYVLEAFARSFVGTFYLIDYDTVDVSNINRQLVALQDTVGKRKVDLWKERVLLINPNASVVTVSKCLTPDNMDMLLDFSFDYIIDACDMVSTKMELIRFCEKHSFSLISCMGTALKMKPELLEICDIRKTSYDPLAKPIRKMVKDERIKMKVPVLYSKECGLKKCDEVLGSSVFVPSVAGVMIANYVVRDWIGFDETGREEVV